MRPGPEISRALPDLSSDSQVTLPNFLMDKVTKEIPVAVLQTAVGADRSENHRHTLDLARQAAGQGARILCTQEIYQGHYFCQTEDHQFFSWALAEGSAEIQDWQNLAKELEVVVVVSYFEKRAPGLYHNTACVIDADGTHLGLYRKTHIPDDPQFMEKFYFTPGDLGYRVFPTRYRRVGVLICWDQWFPEAARITAMMGAEIIFYPTAIGWLPEEKNEYGEAQVEAWLTVQRSHAIANGCYIAAANRIGLEKPESTQGIEFWGNSFVIDPYGRFVSRASSSSEEALIGVIKPDLIDVARTHWPFLRDRRIDLFGQLQKRYLD